ncbi:MAG: hypothetical protein N2486_01920 [Caloramator sp.]|nr:hypothetical protein [Caloramator sp.]
MKPNTKKLNELVEQKFNGNKALFAKTLGIKRSQVSMVLNHGNCVGAKFYGALFAYCEKEGLNFKDYIFLPESVKKLDTQSTA